MNRLNLHINIYCIIIIIMLIFIVAITNLFFFFVKGGQFLAKRLLNRLKWSIFFLN